MNCNCEQNAIVIVRNNDTDWNGGNFLTINLETEILDLSDFKAVLNMSGVIKEFDDLSSGSIEVNLTATETKNLPPFFNGVLNLIDSTNKVATIESLIPFKVISQVHGNAIATEPYTLNFDVKQGGETILTVNVESAVTVEVGTTTTLPAGSDATVTNVGTLNHLVLDFGIPQGIQGEKGETGADGQNATITGATATVNNTVGTPSVTVTSGGTEFARSFNFDFRNLKGEQGVQGIQGIQGERGEDGIDGQDGEPAKINGVNSLTINAIDGVTLTQIGNTATISGNQLQEDIITVQNSIGNGTITINQGGALKGTFTVNQSGNTTIDLDAGGSGGGAVESVNGQTGVVVLDAEDVGALPDSTVIPTKTSDLTNDSNFATVSQIPTNNNQLTNGAGYITSASLPTKVSDLTNDSGYITNSALTGYATETFVTSQGYITESDLPTAGTGIDINSNNEISIIQTKTKDGFTIVGSPSIVNKVASNFSGSNYIVVPETITSTDTSWEIGFAFLHTTNDFQYIVGCDNNEKSFMIEKNSSNKLYLWASSDGNNWDIADGGRVSGTYTVAQNTKCYVKLAFTGSSYILSGSQDGITYTNSVVVNSSTKINGGVPIRLGSCWDAQTKYLQGNIYLEDCYLKIDNKLIWSAYNIYTPALATDDLYGLVKPDGTSITVNDGVISSNITSSDVTTALGYVPEQSSTIQTLSATDSITLADNTIYNGDEQTALTITLPSTDTLGFLCEIDFSSGTTASTLAYSNTIKWLGDDLENGVFVPQASKRYMVVISYDGVEYVAIVKGIE